jgi:hypothetical protein
VALKHSSIRANRDPSRDPEPGGVSVAQTTLQAGVPEVEKRVSSAIWWVRLSIAI